MDGDFTELIDRLKERLLYAEEYNWPHVTIFTADLRQVIETLTQPTIIVVPNKGEK